MSHRPLTFRQSYERFSAMIDLVNRTEQPIDKLFYPPDGSRQDYVDAILAGQDVGSAFKAGKLECCALPEADQARIFAQDKSVLDLQGIYAHHSGNAHRYRDVYTQDETNDLNNQVKPAIIQQVFLVEEHVKHDSPLHDRLLFGHEVALYHVAGLVADQSRQTGEYAAVKDTFLSYQNALSYYIASGLHFVKAVVGNTRSVKPIKDSLLGSLETYEAQIMPGLLHQKRHEFG